MAYCTTAQVKTYLAISGSGDDTLIGDLIGRAEASIDNFTRRTFEADSNTDRTLDSDLDTEGRRLLLGADLFEINTVTNGDGNTISSGDYVTEPRNETPFYAITLKGSSTAYWRADSSGDSEDAITISGKWGYSETVPSDIVQACIALTSFLYRRRTAIGTDIDRALATGDGAVLLPGEIPHEIVWTLKQYRRLI